MFGMGGTEILVILVVALLFLGPEKLPDAASKISKGIRELRKQTKELTQTVENDTEIGGAIRELKSALRGDEPRGRIQPRPPKPAPPKDEPKAPQTIEDPVAAELPPAEVPLAVPAPRLPDEVGETEPAEEPHDDSELAGLVKPASGTVAKGDGGDDGRPA